jgi:hypothetical protein
VVLFLESLKLQRNLDNYVFLQSSRVHSLESLDDKQDFQITRVSMLAFICFKLLLFCAAVFVSNTKASVKQVIT